MSGKKNTAAGQSTKLCYDRLAEAQLAVRSNHVDLHVRFLHKIFDFAEAITAAVVLPVGNDDQGFFLLPCLADLLQTQVNSIVQSRPAFGIG